MNLAGGAVGCWAVAIVRVGRRSRSGDEDVEAGEGRSGGGGLRGRGRRGWEHAMHVRFVQVA